MNFGVVVFPGTWSDCDFHYVIGEVLHQPVRYVWHRDSQLADFDCLILPGGFSYGDYLRAGAVAGRSPVVEALPEFVAKGGVVLGSCNGFQILCESKLLPGALMRNECLQYRCQSTFLRVENAETSFTRAMRPGQVLKMPISHGEGKFYADAETLRRVRDQKQIVFRYASEDGRVVKGRQPQRLARQYRRAHQRGGDRPRPHAPSGARQRERHGRHGWSADLPLAPRQPGRGWLIPQEVGGVRLGWRRGDWGGA
jgi:phosphoribosylformylglycinamidine synthase